jgi:hypothetical protein
MVPLSQKFEQHFGHDHVMKKIKLGRLFKGSELVLKKRKGLQQNQRQRRRSLTATKREEVQSHLGSSYWVIR